jgi:hypothetical protein
MKTLRLWLFGFLALAAGGALAQQDISGTWAGKLAIAPGNELNIHFALARQADGSYTAVLTSPDSGAIKNVAANAVILSGDRLTITVDALSGSYEGQLQNGSFAGRWRQEGSEFPMQLSPYTAPVLSQAAKDTLKGSWVGALEIPGGKLTIVARFETNAAGEFAAFLDSPDQGANGLPVTDVMLADGKLTFRIPRVQGEYSGTLAGDRMTGTWKQGPQGLPLELTKGEYKPAVAALSLSAEAMTALAGSWRGKVESPRGPLTLVVRFETGDGKPVAFIDSPDQGAAGLPVTEATFANGKLTLKVAVVRAEYTGDVAGRTITGQWTQQSPQGPITSALTFMTDCSSRARAQDQDAEVAEHDQTSAVRALLAALAAA